MKDKTEKHLRNKVLSRELKYAEKCRAVVTLELHAMIYSRC